MAGASTVERVDAMRGSVSEPVVIFRTQSDVEAAIIRGLLEAHGIPSLMASAVARAVFPFTVNELAEVRIAVHPDDAAHAHELIESHRTESTSGQVVQLRDSLESLQEALSYRFHDRRLLEQAMTHSSWAHERAAADAGGEAREAPGDNESFEFLGDALLGFVVAELLHREYPDYDEGQKSKLKAALVSTTTLARQAEQLALGDCLRLGRGEEKTGGRRKPALLADAYEALLAAIYLDGGFDHARAFVARDFAGLVERASHEAHIRRDYKSALQEHLQAHGDPLPDYRLVSTAGPDHQKEFRVELLIRGDAVAEGHGSTKKDAEQDAARRALERLRR
jgi:ribonuclease-3